MPTADEKPTPGRRRPRTSHSMEQLLDAAIALLDEAGEQALTFRALAARLGGGVGSIYWYVASKDELLDRCADELVRRILADEPSLTGDAEPMVNLRRLGTALFETMDAHPWLGGYLLGSIARQPHSVRLYELFGQQLQRMELSSRQRFHAVSALLGYVSGVGAEMGQSRLDAVRRDETDRNAHLAEHADAWRATDPAEFPFLHEVADDFAGHDDEEQFLAGLDLLLAGLQLQAGQER